MIVAESKQDRIVRANQVAEKYSVKSLSDGTLFGLSLETTGLLQGNSPVNQSGDKILAGIEGPMLCVNGIEAKLFDSRTGGSVTRSVTSDMWKGEGTYNDVSGRIVVIYNSSDSAKSFKDPVSSFDNPTVVIMLATDENRAIIRRNFQKDEALDVPLLNGIEPIHVSGQNRLRAFGIHSQTLILRQIEKQQAIPEWVPGATAALLPPTEVSKAQAKASAPSY